MPELPDVVVYIEALERFTRGHRLDRIRVVSPSLLRTYDPPLSAVEGRTVEGLRRIGKRIVWDMGEELFVVVHLMVAGRFAWVACEAATKKRAGLWIVRGEDALAQHDRGGVEPIEATLAEFSEALLRENRTMKRALTDPRILSGIGNAYSDEILHRARLSPVKQPRTLSDGEHARLYEATRATLDDWIVRLRRAAGDDFPEGVTAFRPEMAVHGRYGKPCPDCSAAVQRIRHADNETNYCAKCQTGGKLLADRALSRLLRADWPRTLEEMEERRGLAPQSTMGRPTRRGHR